MKNKKFGFTLAETLAVVALLGVIAAISIPTMYSKYENNVQKTKLQRAMNTYNSVIKRIAAEHRISSVQKLIDWADSNNRNNCANTFSYFNTAEGSGCTFKTNDGLWWYIGNIQRPIVSFERIENVNDLITNASSMDNKTSFYMVTSFDDENLVHINDKVYEDENPTNKSDEYMDKLFAFLNNETINNNDNEAIIDECQDNTVCKYERGDYNTPCTNDDKYSCSGCKRESSFLCDVYNENGTRIIKKMSCDSQYENCKVINVYYEDGIKIKATKTVLYEINNVLYGEDSICDPKMSGTYVTAANNEECYNSAQCNSNTCNVFNEKGERIMKLTNCSSLYNSNNTLRDISNCKSINIYKSDGKTVETSMTGCNNQTGICQTCRGSKCS